MITCTYSRYMYLGGHMNVDFVVTCHVLHLACPCIIKEEEDIA